RNKRRRCQGVSGEWRLGGFFCSSRRRHTRSKRDWSSDVCSSDLDGPTISLVGGFAGERSETTADLVVVRTRLRANDELVRELERSEERRVGKESRCRGCR